MKRWLTLWILVFAAGNAYCDTVLKTQPKNRLVAISFDSEKTFSFDSEVCLIRGEISVACGVIFKLLNKGAVIYLYYGLENVFPGAELKMVLRSAAPRSRILVAGASFKMPRLEFQQLFASHFSYGLLGQAIILSNGAESLKGIAAMMTLSYYSSSRVFSGLWIMGGAGMHIVNFQDAAGTRVSVTSLISQLSLGWRFRISDFTFALAGGGQYYLDKRTHSVVKNSGIYPLAMLDIGFLF